MTKQPHWTFNGESVLDEKGNNACTKVNGPLIAAAPELLEALRLIVSAELDSIPHGVYGIASPLLDKAQAAIAKATQLP